MYVMNIEVRTRVVDHKIDYKEYNYTFYCGK